MNMNDHLDVSRSGMTTDDTRSAMMDLDKIRQKASDLIDLCAPSKLDTAPAYYWLDAEPTPEAAAAAILAEIDKIGESIDAPESMLRSEIVSILEAYQGARD